MPRRHHPRRCRRHHPQTVLANGDADFAIAWVPKALASREAGANIVDIAQVFQRSGTLQVSFKDSGITSPADFAGKKIGNWGYGNEFEVFAAMTKAGIDPARRRERGPAVRHGRPARGRHRRRRGDDLQRVRTGARGHQPRHRRALHTRRLQRHLLRGRGRRNAAGRHLGRRQPSRRRRLQRHGSEVRRRLVAGLGLLPRQRRRLRLDRQHRSARSWVSPTRRGR